MRLFQFIDLFGLKKIYVFFRIWFKLNAFFGIIRPAY